MLNLRGLFLTWSFSHKTEYLLLLMADFTTCISRSSMRKFRSPNQNTKLWEKSFHEKVNVYTYFCKTACKCFPHIQITQQWMHQLLHVTVLCANLLVVKNPRGSLTLELLLLQDTLEILHALFGVFHVSRQVTVEEADGVTEHRHAGTHPTFIPL